MPMLQGKFYILVKDLSLTHYFMNLHITQTL